MSIAALVDLVEGLVAGDQTEADQRADVLAWLRDTDDVYRRAKPDTPPRHLVSYVVPVDRRDGSILLIDHINAGLWLPPGGHVEVKEDPAETARREALEELGLDVTVGKPIFITVTTTVGIDKGHTDVSLWYPVLADRHQPLVTDAGEFTEARWWSLDDVDRADPGLFDPHLGRFLRKLRQR
ncbi:NUDIX domain-containing protein [Asanoa siamensis]|uniref:DNA mismatch repair protein MutT n=1 Tax=Asanoa siamensis TaxID=926357 RepID=A0ABQ4CYN6_9ACTN|nr:NUDIX hydrolase [Asanoa siamensis]GIF76408.1 DNA mismatch repair protein MutT [Asanoa siamensis]